MVVEQLKQEVLDKLVPLKDITLATIDDNDQGKLVNRMVLANQETPQASFEGLIHEGQKVFLVGTKSIGRIKKLLPGNDGIVSFLVIQTGHLWGKRKVLPVTLVSEVTSNSIWLSINREKFKELPNYKTDALIKNEVENALWQNDVLRVTDYPEIDIRVKNGVVWLNGHITGLMNLKRIESAFGNVKGILGVKNLLVSDETLLLKVAEALVCIERITGNHVFAKVHNGIVELNGKAINSDVRVLAEQCAASVPSVRGVINNIAAPGVEFNTKDQRFFQPAIGEKIYFHDGPFGYVRQVIINRNNRRVVDMIIQGKFPEKPLRFGSRTGLEIQPLERLAVVPVSAIRYLTKASGFLLIDSTETTRYKDFNPTNFVTPEADWVPPYPYFVEDVRFRDDL